MCALFRTLSAIHQAHFAPRTVEDQPVALRTPLEVELATQPRPLAQALADLAADAVGRPHDGVPRGRGGEVQPALDLRDPVVAVEGLGQAVRNVLLGRQARGGVACRKVFGQDAVRNRPCGTRRGQPLEPLAAQLGRQRCRDEPFAAAHLDLSDRKDRVAAAGRLRAQGRGIGLGVLRPLGTPRAVRLGRDTLAVDIAEGHPRVGHLDARRGGYHAPRAARLEQPVEAVVVVAVDLRPGGDPLHAVGRDARPVDGVDVRADKGTARAEAESVARRERRRALEREAPPLDTPHAPDILAHGLRRVERRDTGPPSGKEVLRLAAREALGGVRLEVRDAHPDRGAYELRPCGEGLVHDAAVVGHDVADVARILETALDLEARHAGIEQLADVCREVQVAHREQVPAAHVGVSGAVREVPRQAAGLAARPAVAAARRERPREEAAAAVADTDGPVDETFDLGGRRGADRPDLLEREGPLEDHAREARLGQEARPLGRAVAHLRRGVQFDGQVHAPQGHVLHDEGVDPGVDERAGLPLCLLQFVVPQQRVERGMDPHAVAVGILRDAGDLLGAVAGGLPRPELRAADIDGIGAVVHGGDGRAVIPGRGQQFDTLHLHNFSAKIGKKHHNRRPAEGKNAPTGGCGRRSLPQPPVPSPAPPPAPPRKKRKKQRPHATVCREIVNFALRNVQHQTNQIPCLR